MNKKISYEHKIINDKCCLFLFLLGFTFTFLPDEILHYLEVENNFTLKLIFQLCGALYIGFAILNWMQRRQIIGGIYSRPLLVGNVFHFLSGALAFIKVSFIYIQPLIISIISVFYIVFAIAFFALLFISPVNKKTNTI